MKIFVCFVFLLASSSKNLAKSLVISTQKIVNSQFELILSTDKDQPEYKLLEMKGESFPKLSLVHKNTSRVLAIFDYRGDVNDDNRNLREHIKTDWSLSTVAITISDRYYSHIEVYVLKGTYDEPECYTKVSLPDLQSIIKLSTPKFKEFRARWHEYFQGWPNQNLIMMSAGASAQTYERKNGSVEFNAYYSFIFDISDPSAPILVRMEFMK